MNSRIRESITALQGQSAWSPMPEHLLFAQLDKDKSPTPVVSDAERICEECGMKFKSEAMLTYHKVGFCVGPPTEELLLDEIRTETSLELTEDFKDVQSNRTKKDHGVKNATLHTASESKANKKSPPKLEWCMCAHGAVAPSAIKIGYDDSDQTYTYLCVAKVGEEIIPGTVLPPRKHATVLYRGHEIKATDYSVLTDLGGLTTWTPCDIAGSIPRDAIRGGYDSNELQYFIARGKAPDGNWCCGQYLPQEQQCIFAWEGKEYKTTDFEILCKITTKQYFNNLNTNMKSDSETEPKYRQETATTSTKIQQDKTLTHDFTRQPRSTTQFSLDSENIPETKRKEDSAVITTGLPITTDGSLGKSGRQITGIVNQRSPRKTYTPEIVKSGTQIKTQDKYSPGASQENKSEEKDVDKRRELTKSGISRKKDVLREHSRNNSKPELTMQSVSKEQVPKENSNIVSQRESTMPRASKEKIVKETSKLASQRELTTSHTSNGKVVKEKSKLSGQRGLTMHSTSKEPVLKERRTFINQQELSTSVSKEQLPKEKTETVPRRELSSHTSDELQVTDRSKLNSQRKISTASASKPLILKEKSKTIEQREFTTAGISKDQVTQEKSAIINQRELSKSGSVASKNKSRPNTRNETNSQSLQF